MGTFIVAIILVVITICIVKREIKNRMNGCSGCGCDCGFKCSENKNK